MAYNQILFSLKYEVMDERYDIDGHHVAECPRVAYKRVSE